MVSFMYSVFRKLRFFSIKVYSNYIFLSFGSSFSNFLNFILFFKILLFWQSFVRFLGRWSPIINKKILMNVAYHFVWSNIIILLVILFIIFKFRDQIYLIEIICEALFQIKSIKCFNFFIRWIKIISKTFLKKNSLFQLDLKATKLDLALENIFPQAEILSIGFKGCSDNKQFVEFSHKFMKKTSRRMKSFSFFLEW